MIIEISLAINREPKGRAGKVESNRTDLRRAKMETPYKRQFEFSDKSNFKCQIVHMSKTSKYLFLNYFLTEGY